MSDDVILRVENGVGRITLARPDALHTLTLPMCREILSALRAWAVDDAVHLAVIDHMDGTRGFCAGGDIRVLAESSRRDGAAARAFMAEEYRVNVAIEAFPKPYLAIMDGVTMGGGVGVSVHGSHRIATDRTVFAMPETGIGLFPDVGAGWFLPRLRGGLGVWLALTGARLKGGDVARAGLATAFVPSELLPNLKKKLLQADFSIDAAAMLNVILEDLMQTPPAASYADHLGTMDRCFAFDTVEEIIAALEADGGGWAADQARIIRSKSPESVKIALRQLREGAALERFEDNMRMEYRITWRKVQSHDFIEGVRAVILDKDDAPAWSPSSLEEVSEAHVDGFFAPLGEHELEIG